MPNKPPPPTIIDLVTVSEKMPLCVTSTVGLADGLGLDGVVGMCFKECVRLVKEDVSKNYIKMKMKSQC